MAETNGHRGMGWLPDYPDFRDHTVELDELPTRLKALGQRDSVKAMLKKVGVAAPLKTLPTPVDLRAWCSPIEDQGALGSCTANAGWGWWSTLSAGPSDATSTLPGSFCIRRPGT